MDHFLELTKMERIETMRLALETLVRIKQLPKAKGDAINEIWQAAETFAICLAQEKKAEQPAVPKDFLSQKQCSEDLIRSLHTKT